jgi:hypothetical protein
MFKYTSTSSSLSSLTISSSDSSGVDIRRGAFQPSPPHAGTTWWSGCCRSLWWDGLGHIDGSDTVTAKCQSSSTLADPLHKNIRQIKEFSDIVRWSTEIETMLTSMKARSALWDTTVFGEWLSASVASFVNRPNISALGRACRLCLGPYLGPHRSRMAAK